MSNGLPSNFVVYTRDQLAQIGRTAWLIRHRQSNPSAPLNIKPKSLPYIVTQVIADMATPILSNAVALARAYLIRQTFGDRLVARAAELGMSPLPATSSSGFVVCQKIAAGGAFIAEFTQLIHVPSSQIFQVQQGSSGTYNDGDLIPVVGTTLGPSSNLAAGSVLTWQNPPAGVSNTASVQPQNDGAGNTFGLSGGRDAETDAELQDRMIDRLSNPPASGNGAQIIFEVERTAGVPVEKCWVIAGTGGPGTVSVLFTVRPDPLTGSRIPNAVQLSQVEANLLSLFPADYAIHVCQLLSVTVPVLLRVSWKTGVTSWADPNPWPPVGLEDTSPATFAYVATLGTPTPTISTARVSCQVLDLSLPPAAIPAPQPGQTIGFFEYVSKTFKRKRILTVTPVNPLTWDLTFDTTSGASDPYVPVAFQGVSAWSDSLNNLPQAVLGVFGGMGPGEQFAVLPDPGYRQRRFPKSPDVWPSLLNNADVVGAVKGTGSVADTVLEWPLTPYSTAVGVPGVLSYLLQLGDLVVSYQ